MNKSEVPGRGPTENRLSMGDCHSRYPLQAFADQPAEADGDLFLLKVFVAQLLHHASGFPSLSFCLLSSFPPTTLSFHIFLPFLFYFAPSIIPQKLEKYSQQKKLKLIAEEKESERI